MPHTFSEGAILAGRVIAGIAAATAFYFALFLFQDEAGIWQNRLETFWAAVYDRAKTTGSTTALFNQLGETLRKAFNRVFGERILSLQAFAISVNLSICGSPLSRIVGLKIYPWPEHFHSDLGWAYLFFFLLIFVVLPLTVRNRWTRRISCIPILCTAIYLPLSWFQGLRLFIGALAMTAGFLSDFLVLAAIREIFRSISTTLSIRRIARLTIVFALLSGIVLVAPYYWALRGASRGYFPLGFDLGGEIERLNLTTSLACLTPLLVIAVVLLHRILWPLLSRIFSSLAPHKIATNRAALIAVGSLCLAVALNLEHIGLKDILKLFS
jgi:hypothetical protein